MSRLQRVLGVAVTALLVCSSAGIAQTVIEDALKAYGEDNAKGYLQPLADLFGANMQAGYYRTASALPKGRGGDCNSVWTSPGNWN